MGKMIKMRCDKCDYEERLFLGCGKNSCNQRIIEMTLKDNDLEEWHRLIDSGRIVSFQSENLLTECPQCNELQNLYQVTLIDDKNDRYVIKPVCKKCKTITKVIDNWEKAKISCPKCKKGVMISEFEGYWD